MSELQHLLDKLEELEREAFRAPWTYSKWDIECPTCESEGDCNNPECDGAHAPCTTIESPDEYPNGQIVAQFTVPGLSELADRNGAFIVALRNAFPELLAAARERDKLLARVTELEAALQPFAEDAEQVTWLPEEDPMKRRCIVAASSLRRAAEVARGRT